MPRANHKHPIHKRPENIRLLACQTLLSWYQTKSVSFRERGSFRHPQDYTLYKHLVSTVIRHQTTYLFVIEWLTKRPAVKLDREVIICIMLGLAQLDDASKIDAYAAVHETVELIAKLGKPHLKGFINANLRRYCREKEGVTAELQRQSLAVRTSHDPFFVKRWEDRFGIQRAAEICLSNNLLPEVQIVINPRFELNAVLNGLQQAGFMVADVHSTGLTVKNPQGLFANDWMKKGAFLVQDRAFQRLNDYLAHIPKSIVLDACAAPGGKLIHFEWSFGDQIDTLIGMELNGYRLAKLQDNVKNLGSRALLVQGDLLSAPFKMLFDFVLLDVPCSATGIIRKHPEIKWSRTQNDLDSNHEFQFNMLQSCDRLLKPGGHLMYVTCSLEYEENQKVVERFLNQSAIRFQHIPYLPTCAQDTCISPDGYYQSLPASNQMGCFSALLKKAVQ